MRLEAVTAIDRAVFAWDEWYGGWSATVGAGGFVVLAGALARARRRHATATTAAGGPARRAATGVIGEAAARVKLLLADGECEFLSAVAAGEDTVRVSLVGHHG